MHERRKASGLAHGELSVGEAGEVVPAQRHKQRVTGVAGLDQHLSRLLFFFTDTATTEIYTLSLHDALPISSPPAPARVRSSRVRRPLPQPATERARPRPTLRSRGRATGGPRSQPIRHPGHEGTQWRSEEHTSELQSQFHLVCRLLLEKKKK